MANQGAKKRKEENEKHIKKLALTILIANGVYIFLRLVLFSTSTSWPHYVGLVFTSGVYYLTYEWLKDMSRATINDSGELIDGGSDMSSGGLCAYLHDILYVTSFVQISSVISDKFWYTYLIIPAFALYKLWELLLYPYFFQNRNDKPEDEVSRKKREKMERKASRPKFGKFKR